MGSEIVCISTEIIRYVTYFIYIWKKFLENKMFLGTPAVERDTGLVPSDSSPIDAMCEVTGGRSYCITSHRMLNQCIDSLVQKVKFYGLTTYEVKIHSVNGLVNACKHVNEYLKGA